MAGPWEKYATTTADTAPAPASDGPWTRYAPASTPEPAMADQSPMVPVYDAMGNATGFEQAPPKAAPASAGLVAGARGVSQGATLGLADEIYGLGGGTKSLLSGEGFQPGYDRAVTHYREGDKAADDTHPWAYGVGKVVGGVGAVAPMMAAAPELMGVGAAQGIGARIGMGAVSGTALGGVQGFNEGEGVQGRLGTAGVGAVTGGLVGTVAPLAGAAVGRGVQAASDYVTLPSIPGIGRRAANDLAQVYGASPAGAIEQRLGQLGPEAMFADASPVAMSRAQALAGAPEGTAQNTVVNALRARDAGTNARVGATIDEALGPAPVPSQVEAQFARIRAQAGPRYETALGNVPEIDTTPVLMEIGQRMNTASGAELAGLRRARDMLVGASPDGTLVARTDPRYLHGVKGSLDDLIQYGDQQIGIPRGTLNRTDSSLSRVRGSLNDALESQVPGYADANLMASTAHRASEALRSGQEALRPNVHPFDFAQDFTAAPLEGQAAARLGVRADVDRVVGNKVNDLGAVRDAVKGEGDWNRSKLVTAFGNEPVDRVVSNIENEAAFRELYQKAVQNSQTARNTQGGRAVSVREPSAGGSNSDVTLSGIAAGPVGAAGALGVRGARYGLSYIGRQSDIARNDQLARAYTAQGAARDRLVSAVEGRAAAASQQTNLSPATSALVQALLGSADRQEQNAKADFMARLLLQRQQ